MVAHGHHTASAFLQSPIQSAICNLQSALRASSMTPLMKAVQKNDTVRVRELIASGADVDALDPNGDAPLVMAAYLGHSAIVTLLLDAGADVRAVDPSMKATALHAAAYAGRTEAARLLIAGGVDINRQGPRNGYTALHDAIWENHADTARVIIEAGADLTLKAHSGETPLDFARARGRTEIVAMIEGAGRSGGSDI
ncbi:MAG TPA: ankyrin repeat domain-containing protein [Vicinamibacterales bacterium]|nr:ankyrin repeat domain-containing protein [Vicinamibacterales bacterium]